MMTLVKRSPFRFRLGSDRRLPATLGALAILAIVLGPIAWGFATSLKTEVMAVRFPPSFLPSPVTFANYRDVFTYETFLRELWNSTLYAVGAVIVAMAVGIPAGYAAARFEFKGKRLVMLLILATSMVPCKASSRPCRSKSRSRPRSTAPAAGRPSRSWCCR